MTNLFRFPAATTALLSLCEGAAARACPFCDSDTAERVRAGIFGEDFLYTATITLAPFPILFLFIAMLYFFDQGQEACSRERFKA